MKGPKRTRWRRFTAFATRCAIEDIPPRLEWRVKIATALFCVFVVAPLAIYVVWPGPIPPNGKTPPPSPGGLAAFPALFVWALNYLRSRGTAKRLREKGYDAKTMDFLPAWRVARHAAIHMGNLRNRDELLRMLPSRDELELTPLYDERVPADSAARAIWLLADATHRNYIRERGEARRGRKAAEAG